MKLPMTLSFREFYQLTNKMFLSNKYIVLDTDVWLFTRWNEVDDFIYKSWKLNDPNSKITIISIEVRLPQFSIGDTVMIVDTGEIGYIWIIDETIAFIYKKLWPINSYWYYQLDRSDRIADLDTRNLVKIPYDLLHKLQD